jgi:hypothetical protein
MFNIKKVVLVLGLVAAFAACEYNTFELTSGYSTEDAKHDEITNVERFEILGVSSGWSELALLTSYTSNCFSVGEMVYYMIMVNDTEKQLTAIQVDCIRVSDAAEARDFTYVNLNSVRDDTVVVFIPRVVTNAARGTWQVLFTAVGKDGRRSNRMGLTVVFGS